MPGASAALSATPPAPDGERFLFIVETSSGMERLKEQNETAIYELLRSGLFGQMESGDTFGLWTFEKETHAGKFPMQVWDMRRASQLGTIAAAYLSGQHYENSADVKRMTDLLTTVTRAARNLNVFILSDGSSIRGTPFDKAINAEYRKKRRERSAAKQPFVTTLFARDGVITNYSVVVAGRPIQLPERPRSVVAVAPKAVSPTNRPAGVLLAVTSVPPVTAPVTSATTARNQPSSVAPVAAPVSIATIAHPPSNLVAKPESPAQRIMQIVTKSNNLPAAVEPAATETARPGVTLASDATATNNATQVPAAAAPAPPAPPVPTAVAGPPAAENPAPHAAFAQILPQPIVVAARELHPEPAEANPAPPPTVQAAALPVPQSPGAGLFLAFGSLLMAAACFLLIVVFRRVRPAPGASLITQSMERR
jgi:hypothetical protein